MGTVGPVFLSKGCGSIGVSTKENFASSSSERAPEQNFSDCHGHVKPNVPFLGDCHTEQEINLLAFTFLDHKAFAHFREESLCEVGRRYTVGNVVNICTRHDDAAVRKYLSEEARVTKDRNVAFRNQMFVNGIKETSRRLLQTVNGSGEFKDLLLAVRRRGRITRWRAQEDGLLEIGLEER